jgi:hypothetical protein
VLSNRREERKEKVSIRLRFREIRFGRQFFLRIFPRVTRPDSPIKLPENDERSRWGEKDLPVRGTARGGMMGTSASE